MNDQQIEQEIQAKGLTAPRVTPADIEAAIASEHYFTAEDGVIWANNDDELPPVLSLLTFCVLVLKNGFTVTGESACASPENFDAKIGRDVARQNAVNKIWPLLGYALKQELHRRAKFDAEPKTGQSSSDNTSVATSGERSAAEFMSFNAFVQYGRDNGANIVNGMPWSFTFKGYGVTHENDKCYLLMRGAESIRLTDDDDLVIYSDGSLGVTPMIPF